MDFDHLVLLIGTNPLPNYVVAKYFLQHAKSLNKITAIHSTDTASVTERLEKVLKRLPKKFLFNYCGLDNPGDASKIRSDISKSLFATKDKDIKLHLNYTGGTKAMGVQAYRTIYTDIERIENASFSYLNARDFRIRTDDNSLITGDLRKEIDIDFDDLWDLHNCSKNPDSEAVDWSNANKIILTFFADNLILDFIKWKNDQIRRNFYRNGSILKKPDKVTKAAIKYLSENTPETNIEHPFHKKAMELLANFPKPQSWHFNEREELQISDSKDAYSHGKGDFVKGIKYLDGGWLEFYVYQLIKENLPPEMKVVPNQHLKKKDAGKDFEIDCLLLCGYHLCGISITTSNDEKQCKTKAFEILHRSQQLGGEEARSMLITTLDREKAELVERDMEIDTGGKTLLKVLSVDDVFPVRLWAKIYNYIKEIK